MSQSNNPSESTFGKAKTWVLDSLTQENSLKAYLEPLIQIAAPGWSSETVRSKVLRVRQEADDIFSLVIKPGKGWKGFEAGQHLQITAEQNGSLQTRIFSVSPSPG